MHPLTKKIVFTGLFSLLLGITISTAQSENKKIDSLIHQKRLYNKKHKNSTVYKIQLYNGAEEEAYTIRQKFMLEFPDYTTKIVYSPPEWKTQVGNFKTRLEADRVFAMIKEKFIGAIVLEDKI